MIHSIKTRDLEALVLKLDLSKAYDRVKWDYLRLIILHIGIPYVIVKWIMSCVTYANYAVLVNGSPTRFFIAKRGLRQGCSMSPLLFLLLIEGLSRMLRKERLDGCINGVSISMTLALTHILFVDDIIIFRKCDLEEWLQLSKVFKTFCAASRMVINLAKSNFLVHKATDEILQRILELFLVSLNLIDEGFKYLGYRLKPNFYGIMDWHWLLAKVEK